MGNIIQLSTHRKMRNRIISEAACVEVARAVNLRPAANEAGRAFVARIVRLYLEAAEAQP